MNADGTFQPDRRTSLPMQRPKGVPTPCGSCEKVPAFARQAARGWRELRKLAVDMTPANRAAWRFYRECRAVNQFPADPLVRWYSAVIRDVEDAIERRPIQELAAAVDRLAASQPRKR